jgi:hypothetical protein
MRYQGIHPGHPLPQVSKGRIRQRHDAEIGLAAYLRRLPGWLGAEFGREGFRVVLVATVYL